MVAFAFMTYVLKAAVLSGGIGARNRDLALRVSSRRDLDIDPSVAADFRNPFRRRAIRDENIDL
jgi:hypothetical protein